MKPESILLIIITTLLVICFIVFMVFRPPVSYTCSDFNNRMEALKAYKSGAIYLDRDKDGVPCESLKF